MKFLYFSLFSFCFHCSFANLDRGLKEFPRDSNIGKISESVTILNQNRMYFRKKYKGWEEVGPIYGESPAKYFAKKQDEIGRSRYPWKEVSIHNIDEKEFQLTNVKTDYVFFVTANRPRSD